MVALERRAVKRMMAAMVALFCDSFAQEEGVLPRGVDETRKMEHPRCRKLRRSRAYQPRSE